MRRRTNPFGGRKATPTTNDDKLRSRLAKTLVFLGTLWVIQTNLVDGFATALLLLPVKTTQLLSKHGRYFSLAKTKDFTQLPMALAPNEESTTTATARLEWIPSRIEFEGVYRSYGAPSVWRKLTSSVPRREYALSDLTLAFGQSYQTPGSVESNDNGDSSSSETQSMEIVTKAGTTPPSSSAQDDAVCLLVGASSSGKSTIFRSILEATSTKDSNNDFGSPENRGSLSIRSMVSNSEDSSSVSAKPILLDDRGVIKALSSGPLAKKTLGEAWKDKVLGDASHHHPSDGDATSQLAESLATVLAEEILDLPPDALLEDLTPSQAYRFCLGNACLESSLAGANTIAENNNGWRLPGPILLLDEWMDVETSAVVQKVRPSLHKIVEELHGIVVSITHKPELYGSPSGDGSNTKLRKITLSAGKILSDY